MPGRPASAPRDLNGRPVRAGRWDRLRQRLRGRGTDEPIVVGEPGLVVVAESDDEAAASSAVLASSGWRPEEEVVLRHVLLIPRERADDAAATGGLDGYERVVDDAVWVPAAQPHLEVVILARGQLLDAVHLSQERSRMASLGSRHGGVVVRWQVLQRPVERR
ncbi:hypothetical protein EEB19_23255 [Gordonia sp. OPL2]|nr:hypothetical protein EEB19_23255 [Gordonia sp. OPL2]